MKRILVMALVVVAGLTIMQPASAGGYGRGFSEMAERQRERIRDGIRMGELTRHEVRKLYRKQMHLRQLKHRFMSDGYLTHKERRKLRKAYRKASEQIARLRHNNERRRFSRRHHRHHDRWWRDNDWYWREHRSH